METFDPIGEYKKLVERERERHEQEASQMSSARNEHINSYPLNTNVSYDSQSTARLDSNIKKTTSYVRKLKQLSAESIPALLKDAQRLNLSKFVSELSQSIGTSKLNHRHHSEFFLTCKLCSIFHRLYPSFSSDLLSHLLSTLIGVDSFDALRTMAVLKYPLSDNVTKNRTSPAQRRASLLLLTELSLAGLSGDSGGLIGLLERLYLEDKAEADHIIRSERLAGGRPGAPGGHKQGIYDRDEGSSLYNLPCFISFLRFYGDLGHFSVFKHCQSDSNQSKLIELIKNYADLLVSFSHHTMTLWSRVVAENEAFLAQKGSISEFESKREVVLKNRINRIVSALSVFSLNSEIDASCLEIKKLEIEEEEKGKVLITTDFQSNSIDDEEWGAFDSTESKTFYTLLLPLPELLPENYIDRRPSVDESTEVNDDVTADVTNDVTETQNLSKVHDTLSLLLQQLPDVFNTEKCDKLIIDIALTIGKSKTKRKRVAMALLSPPANRLSVLPFYARTIATLSIVFPEVGQLVLDKLVGSFHKHSKISSQSSKSGNFLTKDAALLAELCKFSVAPPSIVLKCLVKALSKFQHHNISAACLLLEGCGRFLYHNEHVKPHLFTVLERLKKITTHKILDDRMKSLVSNAWHACTPPEKANTGIEELTTEQKWIIHVLSNCYKSPGKSCDSLRRMDWTDDDFNFIVNTFLTMAPQLGLRVAHLAKTLSFLSDHHPEVLVRVVDEGLDALKYGFLTGDETKRQLRLSIAGLIGHLAFLAAIPTSALVSFATDLLFNFPGPDTSSGINFDTFRVLVALSLIKPLIPQAVKEKNKGFNRRGRRTIKPSIASIRSHPVCSVVIYAQMFVFRQLELVGSVSEEVKVSIQECLLGLNGAVDTSSIEEATRLLEIIGQNSVETRELARNDSETEVESEVDSSTEVNQGQHDSDGLDASDWSEHEPDYEDDEEEAEAEAEDDFDKAFSELVNDSITQNFNTAQTKSGLEVNVPLVRQGQDSSNFEHSEFTVVRLFNRQRGGVCKKVGKTDSKPILVPRNSLSFANNEAENTGDEELKKAVMRRVEYLAMEESRRFRPKWKTIS
ncbi:hypothetical protein P9112_006588 [Eukaryota sp. TZLM1-RC]